MRLRATRLTAVSNPYNFTLFDNAVVDFRFAENKALVDTISGNSNLITYSGSANGSFFDSSGVRQTASTNTARFNHSLAGASRGLLVEESRTNSIRNNTMVGAVAGTPGTPPTQWSISAGAGVAVQIVGTGVTNGINYIDVKYFGTTTASFSTQIFPEINNAAVPISASVGQTWTSSYWLAIVAGSINGLAGANGNIFHWLRERNSGGGFLDGNFIQIQTALSSTLTRYETQRTLTNPSVARITNEIQLFCSVIGTAIDITLRVGMPQLELGAGATSVIATNNNGTVTRTESLADLVSSAIANGIRSFYAEFYSSASGTRGVVSLNDNTANERASLVTSGVDPRLIVVDGGVEQANIDGGTVSAGALTKVACRIDTNSFAISVNGAAAVTDTSGTLPTVDRIMFGRSQSGDYLNNSIARFTGWLQPMSDAELRALTA